MENFLPFLKTAKIFRWGPIPGKYFYVSELEDAVFKDYSNIYSGERWPNTLFLFKEKRMVWVNDLEELEKSGKDVFVRYMLNQRARGKLKETWLKAVKKLSNFEKKIDDLYLADLSDDNLRDLWQEFYNLIIEFWLPTVPSELSGYGSGKLLEEKLRKYVKDEAEIPTVLEILTTPENPSFYQEEEIDLARTKDIEKHAKKYFWLRNSYSGAENLQADFFIKRKKELHLDIKKLIEDRSAGIKSKKRKAIQKYELSEEVKDIAKALVDGIEWQDERKKYIFIYTHYKELFLKEVARRFNYDIDSLRNCSSRENMQILEKRGAHMLIERRANNFGFFMDPLKKEINGGEAVAFWDEYAKDKSPNSGGSIQ